MLKEKLKAARAELKMRQRTYNAAARDLNRVIKQIERLEARIELKLARSQ